DPGGTGAAGGQVAAWRRKAGLTQREVTHLAGYPRSAISHAEIGDPASRDLIEAADRAVGAGGRLIAAHDAITAAVTAARSQAARQARAWAATPAEADSTPPAPSAGGTAQPPRPRCPPRAGGRH